MTIALPAAKSAGVQVLLGTGGICQGDDGNEDGDEDYEENSYPHDIDDSEEIITITMMIILVILMMIHDNSYGNDN